MAGDDHPVCVQVEHRLYPFDDGMQSTGIGDQHSCDQGLLFLVVGDFEFPWLAMNENKPEIALRRYPDALGSIP
jgi:hypothetical protein